jgi:diacylglycerol O-acyltransferase
VGNKATLVLTNVPGPDSALKIQNHVVDKLFFFVPALGTVGLGMSIISYNGAISVGIQADTSVCDNTKTLIKYFNEELDTLSQASRAQDENTTATTAFANAAVKEEIHVEVYQH